MIEAKTIEAEVQIIEKFHDEETKYGFLCNAMTEVRVSGSEFYVE